MKVSPAGTHCLSIQPRSLAGQRRAERADTDRHRSVRRRRSHRRAGRSPCIDLLRRTAKRQRRSRSCRHPRTLSLRSRTSTSRSDRARLFSTAGRRKGEHVGSPSSSPTRPGRSSVFVERSFSTESSSTASRKRRHSTGTCRTRTATSCTWVKTPRTTSTANGFAATARGRPGRRCEAR
jgi:hypothetical protein